MRKSKVLDSEGFDSAVARIKESLTYPIIDYPSLVNAVGEKISIGQETVALEDLRRMAEAAGGTQDYLPITDPDDLVVKARKFYNRVMQQSGL